MTDDGSRTGDDGGGDVSDLTLAEVLAEAADGLAGVIVDASESITTWAAGPAVFATLTGDRAEFRLDPLVAAAALRTPGTEPSARGGDWIAFAPAIIDDHALDRAEAWFLSAHRRAAASRRA
ncbi:MAG TPA: hypothetical protein VHS36_04700 [Candidatus Limnocylindrales bacterium]|nr:hypothetical protein [Candidatus Limnocylindrales bacterium]